MLDNQIYTLYNRKKIENCFIETPWEVRSSFVQQLLSEIVTSERSLTVRRHAMLNYFGGIL